MGYVLRYCYMKAHAIYLVFADLAFSGVKSLSRTLYLLYHHIYTFVSHTHTHTHTPCNFFYADHPRHIEFTFHFFLSNTQRSALESNFCSFTTAIECDSHVLWKMNDISLHALFSHTHATYTA